jgi:hypothetical protein
VTVQVEIRLPPCNAPPSSMPAGAAPGDRFIPCSPPDFAAQSKTNSLVTFHGNSAANRWIHVRFYCSAARGAAAIKHFPAQLPACSEPSRRVPKRSKQHQNEALQVFMFIDENGGGPGVRLRKRHQKKS